ncbi:MAG: response regulator, partial [Candidatus Tectomicrobia bacterium]
ENGQEALAILDGQAFDVVLMDIQMPKIDGREATALIRAQEQDGAHLPIIAVTAHALPGDRERCLKAGMDDYVTKPVHLPALLAAIARVVPSVPHAESDNTVVMSPAEGVFDCQELLARVNGDISLLHELVALFLDGQPQRLAHLQEAVRGVDRIALARMAHSLKGTISNFCAQEAFDAALHLESVASTGDPRGIEEAYTTLVAELERLQKALRDLSNVPIS